ncbi:36395_t:CDS:2 [Gigaspora margarita]|uniref:36395_t:CDS:1 n=1 Tax=Gigaspora margarita TaxID=4874 RepID=A0ABN7UHV3_GIGMA|nr:36395_t:CDS:2 [Gigaspora margarita]
MENDENDIKTLFLEADKIKPTIESLKHQNNIYIKLSNRLSEPYEIPNDL